MIFNYNHKTYIKNNFIFLNLFRFLFFLKMLFSFDSVFAKQISFAFQDYPPYHGWNKDSHLAEGASVEMVMNICLKLRHQCNFIEVPTFARFLQEVKDGACDGSPSIVKKDKDSEQNNFLLFSEPIFQSNYAYMGVEGYVQPIKRIEDLKGWTVGLVRGSRGEILAKNAAEKTGNLKIVPETNLNIALKKLSDKHYADFQHSAILANEDVARYYATEISLKLKTIFVSEVSSYAMAFSKRLDSKIIADFNRELNEMRENGELKKIAEKYGVILFNSQKN